MKTVFKAIRFSCCCGLCFFAGYGYCLVNDARLAREFAINGYRIVKTDNTKNADADHE